MTAGGVNHSRGPGGRETVEESCWSDAEQDALFVADVPGKYSDRLDRVRGLLADPPDQN